MTDTHALVLDALTVNYPSFTLGPLTLESEPGEILAVVGPNGSGKTTLLRAICGLQQPTAGTVTIAGITPTGRADELLERVAYIPDDYTELLADLTGTEIWDLHMLAHERRGRDRSKMQAAVESFQTRFEFRPPHGTVAGYSHGMAKKTQLIAGLMHEPPVLILDEPHNGLDVSSIREIDRFIASLRDDGVAVVLATHNLGYAERVADRVLLLRSGHAVRFDTPEAITTATGEPSLEDAFFHILETESI